MNLTQYRPQYQFLQRFDPRVLKMRRLPERKIPFEPLLEVEQFASNR